LRWSFELVFVNCLQEVTYMAAVEIRTRGARENQKETEVLTTRLKSNRLLAEYRGRCLLPESTYAPSASCLQVSQMQTGMDNSTTKFLAGIDCDDFPRVLHPLANVHAQIHIDTRTGSRPKVGSTVSAEIQSSCARYIVVSKQAQITQQRDAYHSEGKEIRPAPLSRPNS
jgi:hypothetical protein